MSTDHPKRPRRIGGSASTLVQQPHEEQLATLGQLSEQALAAVTVRKCIECFQGIRHFIPRCLRQEDFLQDHA